MSNTTQEVENTQINESQENSESQTKPQDGKVSFLQTMGSVVAASFGVQSKKNKQRDFQNGSFGRFVIGALIFTVAFVAVLVFVVNMVLS